MAMGFRVEGFAHQTGSVLVCVVDKLAQGELILFGNEQPVW